MTPDTRSFPSPLVELAGWATFLLFVATVYRLRQALDRAAKGR